MAPFIIAHPALARVLASPFHCGGAAGLGLPTVGRVRP
jgi:hypothetical protein